MLLHTTLLLCSLLAPITLQAAVFSVSTVAELESALATANSNGEDDLITLAAGTYTLTSSLGYDSQGTDEDFDIALQGLGAGAVLDGGQLNSRILFLRTTGHNSDISLTNLTFTNGYAQEGDNGAGLFVNIAASKLSVDNCRITDCFAAAFYFTNHGGGAYITAGLGADVTIRNCVIAGNSAKGLGGGLYLSLTDGTLNFANNTVTGNLNKSSVVEAGGGIYLRLFFDSVVAQLENNILWGNSYAHGDGDLYIEDAAFDPDKGATVNLTHNDIRQLDVHLGDNITDNNNINADPLLTADFHLAATSPCVDGGTSDAPMLPAQDFEGHPRSVDGNCDGTTLPDMGADELYTLPTVSTALVRDITSSTATAGGNICKGGYQAVSSRGVCWSTSPLPSLADQCTEEGAGSGDFTSALDLLTQGVAYTVRAYATNSLGTAYGEERSFTPTSRPTVSTAVITEIDSPTATGGGEILGEGDAPITMKGICWSTSPQPALTDSCTEQGPDGGTYESQLTGLKENTTYYVRAYAVNSHGTGWGEERSFYSRKKFCWSLFLPRIQPAGKSDGPER